MSLTAACSLAAGIAAAWRCAGTARASASARDERPVRFGLFEAAVLLAVLALGAQPTPLITAGGEWRILAEEGVHLFPASAILLGDRLYADVDYLYGPLLVLPLSLGFSVEMPSVFTARVTALVVHGMGLALAAAAGRALFRSRLAWLMASLGLAALVPLAHPRIHLTALRSTVALLPLFFLPTAIRGSRRATLFAGAAAAPAVLMSPEVGAVTLIAFAVALGPGPGFRGCVRRLSVFAVGLLGAGVLFAALLYPVADVVQYLRDGASTLGSIGGGYLSRPFPVPWGADRLWSGDPYGVGLDASVFALRGGILLALVGACGVALAFRWLHRPWTPRELACVAVWLVALGLLPKVIARPGVHQFAKLLPPLVLLVGAFVEEGIRLAAARRAFGRLLPALFCVASLYGLLTLGSMRPPQWPPRFPNLEPRLGPIPVDPQLARLVGAVRTEVDRRLPAGEPIWVTPNAAGWHLLLDRRAAVHSPVILWLPTLKERRAALHELEESAPPLLLRHRLTDAIDGVPIEEYAPEIDAFVRANYRLSRRIRSGRYSVEILEAE
jgi:hypothetical protein